jgi:mono/diheme cytochrome c family protein
MRRSIARAWCRTLKALNRPTPRDYWLQWIAHGKPDTLMPAFAVKEGGPLTEEQIHSLVEWLETKPANKPQ